MTRIVDLLRAERRARVFFALLAQSSFGTGAGYVALILVAYERFKSPWAISLVLAADLLPPMVLGPMLGAAADRWSRRTCAVIADLLRAVAFLSIAFVDTIVATVALALLAGIGTALFTPASLAALPSLVEKRRLPAATSLYGAISDLGLAVGPALAAGLLLLVSPEGVLAANSLTFLASALVLARLSFGDTPARRTDASPRLEPSLVRETREGIRAVRGVSGLRPILGATGVALFFGGLVNVAELPFVTEDLGASEAAFSIVVALVGLGICAGSLAGSTGGTADKLTSRFAMGLLLGGLSITVVALVPSLAVVFVMFVLAGFGNGMALVHERLFIQATVADEFSARVFGLRDALSAWGFGIAFLTAGAAVSGLGPQAVIGIAGVGLTTVGLVSGLVLRWSPRGPGGQKEQQSGHVEAQGV
jgi:predicted MFS family arabinose efflux permease